MSEFLSENFQCFFCRKIFSIFEIACLRVIRVFDGHSVVYQRSKASSGGQ